MSSGGATTSEVRCVILSVGSRSLLLPTAAVAELVSFKEPDPLADAPAWLLGRLDWRGLSVPLISFEKLVGLPGDSQGQRARIAVCNTLNDNPRFSYVGLLAVGLPHLVRVTVSTVETDRTGEQPPSGDLILRAVTLNGAPVWIPNLDRLENRMTEVWPAA